MSDAGISEISGGFFETVWILQRNCCLFWIFCQTCFALNLPLIEKLSYYVRHFVTLSDTALNNPKPHLFFGDTITREQRTAEFSAIPEKQRTHEFKLYFKCDEQHLYTHLKSRKKPGAYLKGLIEKDLTDPEDLFARVFGDIERDYGSMHRFLAECGIDALRNRLNAYGEVRREQLKGMLKERYRELKNL